MALRRIGIATLHRQQRLHGPQDLRQHRLIGYDRDETIERGFAQLGLPLPRQVFALRTDDQVAYGRLIAAGAGIGFVATYNIGHWPGVQRLLPMLQVPPLPRWLAAHRKSRGSKVVRRVCDFVAPRPSRANCSAGPSLEGLAVANHRPMPCPPPRVGERAPAAAVQDSQAR